MIFVIGGETASGKSDLAFRFAKKTNGIIINGDAFAFYQELNIGTAKPTHKELKSVPTFLFNNVRISENYSIYNYQQDGRKVINEYLAKKIPIIIVGGSGLYIRALLYDYKLSPEADEPVVDDITISNATLYARLGAIDPAAAEKIHPNNRKRILRALTIVTSKDTLKSTSDALTSKEPLYPYINVNLQQESEKLTRSINERTRQMFARGLKEEALALANDFDPKLQALQAIGYKEIINNPSESDEFLIELINRKTRQLAKRQRTFFRHQFNGVWFNNKDEALVYLLGKYEEE